jgi:hypothetical protein
MAREPPCNKERSLMGTAFKGSLRRCARTSKNVALESKELPLLGCPSKSERMKEPTLDAIVSWQTSVVARQHAYDPG